MAAGGARRLLGAARHALDGGLRRCAASAAACTSSAIACRPASCAPCRAPARSAASSSRRSPSSRRAPSSPTAATWACSMPSRSASTRARVSSSSRAQPPRAGPLGQLLHAPAELVQLSAQPALILRAPCSPASECSSASTFRGSLQLPGQAATLLAGRPAGAPAARRAWLGELAWRRSTSVPRSFASSSSRPRVLASCPPAARARASELSSRSRRERVSASSASRRPLCSPSCVRAAPAPLLEPGVGGCQLVQPRRVAASSVSRRCAPPPAGLDHREGSRVAPSSASSRSRAS